MSKKTFKIFIDCPLYRVVSISNLSVEDQIFLYEHLQSLVQDDPGIPLLTYQEAVVLGFLAEPEILEGIPSGDREEIIEALYLEIIKAYDSYDIKKVCANINGNILVDEIFQKMSEHITEEMFTRAQGGTTAEIIKAPSTVKIKSLDDVNAARRYIKGAVVGQDNAVNSVCTTIKLLASDLEHHASMFFIGPTGVGKTHLAKALGKRYSGNFCKINCGEYASGHEYCKLIGSPPGYTGHGEKGILTRRAEESNSWVFVFDEIEKASEKLYNLLLSLTDEGYIDNNTGQRLDFSRSIFVFTSNEGIRNLKTDSERVGFGDIAEVSQKDVEDHCRESLKSKFSPEFLNRIDEIVYFKHLSRRDALKIAGLELEHLPIKRNKTIYDFVVTNGYSKEYGARNLQRFIKHNISIKIADAILSKRIPKEGKRYNYQIQNNELFIIDTILFNPEDVILKQAPASGS